MSVVRRHNEQCSQKRNSNIFHVYMFCFTQDSTGYSVKLDGHGMLTNDLHVISLNSCEFPSVYLVLFKVVTADISVLKRDCSSVW
jgi:hypothetical protein